MADDIWRRVAGGIDEASILSQRCRPTCNFGWILLVLEGWVIALEIFAIGNDTSDDTVSRDLAEESKYADEGGDLDRRHCVLGAGWGSKRLEFEECESVTERCPKEGWTGLQSMKTYRSEWTNEC